MSLFLFKLLESNMVNGRSFEIVPGHPVHLTSLTLQRFENKMFISKRL